MLEPTTPRGLFHNDGDDGVVHARCPDCGADAGVDFCGDSCAFRGLDDAEIEAAALAHCAALRFACSEDDDGAAPTTLDDIVSVNVECGCPLEDHEIIALMSAEPGERVCVGMIFFTRVDGFIVVGSDSNIAAADDLSSPRMIDGSAGLRQNLSDRAGSNVTCSDVQCANERHAASGGAR